MPEMTYLQAATRFAALLADFECLAGGKSLPLQRGIDEALTLLRQLRERDATVYLIGNGGSAAVASHVQTDFVNKGRLRAHTLHEPALLTCMSNDYGYPAAFSNILARHARRGDAMICISSSGASENILSSVATARRAGTQVITLSAFGAANPLRDLGDINFWCPASGYRDAEISHLFLLHHIADQLAEAA